MVAFDETIRILAAPREVWEQVIEHTPVEPLVSDPERGLRLIRRFDGLSAIYALRGSEDVTYLRLVMTRATLLPGEWHSREALQERLPALTDDPLVPDEAAAARAHLSAIKDLAEKPMLRPGVQALPPTRSRSHLDVSSSPIARPLDIVLVYCIFGGLFSATLLLALNWWSMGKGRKAISTIISGLVGWSALMLLVAIVALRLDPTLAVRAKSEFTWLMVGLVTSLSVLIWLVLQQKPYYDAAVARYGKGSLSCFSFLNFVLAVFGGVMLGSQWPTLFTDVVNKGSSLLNPLAQQTYQGGGITISYPGGWQPHTDPDFEQLCLQSNVDCLLAVVEPVTGRALMIIRFEEALNLLVTLEGVSSAAWAAIAANTPDVIDSDPPVRLTIDGAPAIRRDFTVKVKEGRMEQCTLLLLQQGQNVIQVWISVPASERGTIDPILTSLHLTTSPTAAQQPTPAASRSVTTQFRYGEFTLTYDNTPALRRLSAADVAPFCHDPHFDCLLRLAPAPGDRLLVKHLGERATLTLGDYATSVWEQYSAALTTPVMSMSATSINNHPARQIAYTFEADTGQIRGQIFVIQTEQDVWVLLAEVPEARASDLAEIREQLSIK